MSERGLITVHWDGDAFVPSSAFQRALAAKRFGGGEVLTVAVEEERSGKQHRFYFAQMNTYWQNLPERYAAEVWAQTMDALRKYLLIRAGYRHATVYSCTTKAEAQRLALAIRPLDPFAVVTIDGLNVVRLSAESQSVKAMGKDRFRASADAVLALAETLVSGGELPAIGVAA